MSVQQYKGKKSLQQVLLVVILCLLTASCTTDETIRHPSTIEDDRETNMTLTINTPPTTIPETKSQTDEESAISEIRVLVFHNGRYAYAEEGSISSSADHSTTFTTTLLASSSPVTLFLIANANASVDNAAIAIGDTPAEVKAKIQYAFTPDGIGGRFPMYGEYTLPSVSSSVNEISGIKMLRAIARADIIVADEVSNFEMVSVQLFRANDQIQVIPDAVAEASVTSPSVPGASDAAIHTDAVAVTGNRSVSQLYIPESSAPDGADLVGKATCIVVGGRHNNSSTITYYRIDFNLGIEGHPAGQILRNRKYIFHILGVNIQGKGTPEEAANSQSMGIVAEVQTWDENSTDMWYEGDQYFSVSTRTVHLRPWGGTFEQSNTLRINTDIPVYTFQWSDAYGTALAGSQPSNTMISNDNYRVTLSGSTITVEALTNNPGDDARLDYFVIHAGRWDIVITIHQYGLSKHAADLIRVLSFTALGDLGSGYADATTGADAIATRQILNKQFGPSGVFRFGGYYFAEMAAITAANTTVTPAVMANHDVLFFTYSQLPNATLSSNVVNWLNAKSNRILIVAADIATTNTNLLAALGDNLGWKHVVTYSEKLAFEVNDRNRLFTQTGLFGSVSPASTFTTYDGTFGRATQLNDEVVPLLKDASGNMILGVNMHRRVVYMGEVQLFNYVAGGLSNNSGAINTDPDRLISNLWAWITETVLAGK